MPVKTPANPWYRAGLSFECTRCGRCCRGPGWVWVTDEEIEALARRLELEIWDFRRRYTMRVRGRGISLVSRGDDDCVFWNEAEGCQVYEDRPRQCRTFPFWAPVVATPSSWKEAGIECPGIDQGNKHEADSITRTASDDGLAPPDRRRS